VRAQVDVLFLIVIFVAVCMAMLVVYAIYQGGIKPQLQAGLATGANANTVNSILNSGSSSLDSINNSLVFIYFAMATAIVIGAFLVEAVPYLLRRRNLPSGNRPPHSHCDAQRLLQRDADQLPRPLPQPILIPDTAGSGISSHHFHNCDNRAHIHLQPEGRPILI
jgi:hypothetical protein